MVDIECQNRYSVQDVTRRDGDAEQVGQLTDDHEDGEAEDETGDDGLGQELRDPAHPEEPGENQDGARRQCDGRRVSDRLGNIGRMHARDKRRGQDRDGGHGSDNQLRRGAERCINQEGDGDGI